MDHGMDFYKDIVNVTCEELLGIMNVSLAQQAKDVVKSFMGRSVRTKDPLFWPAGTELLGLLSAATYMKRLSEKKSKEDSSASDYYDNIKSKCLFAISAHLDMWLKDYEGKIDFVDDALSGYCFVKLYEETLEDKYKEAADKIAQFILTAPRDDQGSIIYNPGRNSSNIFADGIGQVSMFMAAYMSAFPDSDIAISSGSRLDASKQIKNFFEMGVDKKSGLNYHGYSLPDNQKKGLLGWGRAFGWLFMGVAETAVAAVNSTIESEDAKCSEDCPEKKRCFMNSAFNITGLYRQMCQTAIEYQRSDGGWSWQIQGVEGHIDMSATGMIAYSIARGYNAGLISDDITENFNKMRECMLSHTSGGKVTDALSSCDDFGVHYQTYGHYPWGQGMVLAALSEMSQTKELVTVSDRI